MRTDLHTIRFAVREDILRIQTFISQYWRADHVYAINRAFFEYEFLYGDDVNFVLAIDNNNVLHGILGFIQYQQERKGSDICTVIWKVLPKTGDPQLGLRLLMFLVNESGVSSVSSVGANPKTLAIYQLLGYRTGALQHYIIPSPLLKKPVLLKNADLSAFYEKEGNAVTDEGSNSIIEILHPDEVIRIFSGLPAGVPAKSVWFFQKRFLLHPCFRYRFFTNAGNTLLLVIREVNSQGAVALRIMYIAGQYASLAGMKQGLRELLISSGAEYIDFYCTGINREWIKQAGFYLKRKNGKMVVPDYFDPFEQRNVDIHFFTTRKKGIQLFKGDGDQDRPNTAFG
jgi:hypothetical protein